MTYYNAIELKQGDVVDYYGERCSVLSVDKRCGLITIKKDGERGFISFVWPRYLRKVREQNA